MVAIVTIALCFNIYRVDAFNRTQQLEVYNQWMERMSMADSYLSSKSENEKPPNGIMRDNPNNALSQAYLYFNEAYNLADGASMMSSGELSQIDTLMAGISYGLIQETLYMYNQEPQNDKNQSNIIQLKTLISNRDYMDDVLTSTVLKGMPKNATKVEQIKKEYSHLNALRLGVFSTNFDNYMFRTGQFKETSDS